MSPILSKKIMDSLIRRYLDRLTVAGDARETHDEGASEASDEAREG